MTRLRLHAVSAPLAAAAMILLPGCTTANSQGLDNGQKLSQRGASISDRGTKWTAGQKEMSDGQKLIAQSDKNLAAGRKKLRDGNDDAAKAQRQIDEAIAERVRGEQLVASGTQQMNAAEADYQQIRAGSPAITPR